ncbi:hypothetical protein F4604DRAFT_1952307 [Suillus subluteus]|nr:hypothetical protein F4604DRAFT_1952307 [Suillus subluteus]
MKATLQSCLECLDRHNDRLIRVYGEVLEIRTRITELLEIVQSEATVTDSGTRDSSAYLQAIFADEPQNIATVAPDEPNTISPLLTTLDIFGLPQPLTNGLSDQERGPLESVGVMGWLPEDTDPMTYQRIPDVLLCDTSGCVSYKLGAQSFPPEDGTYSERKTLPGSLPRLSPLPIVQGSQDKIKCTWPGCSKFVKKESRTRHVNETHLRKVLDVVLRYNSELRDIVTTLLGMVRAPITAMNANPKQQNYDIEASNLVSECAWTANTVEILQRHVTLAGHWSRPVLDGEAGVNERRWFLLACFVLYIMLKCIGFRIFASNSQCIEKRTPAPMCIVFAATESADTDAYLRNTKRHSHSRYAWLRVEMAMSDFHWA